MSDLLGTGVKVLLVEDDIESGKATSMALESSEMQVTMVQTKNEALDMFLSQSFDVVVSDIRLDGASGVDLLKDIREHNGEFPVILLTAYSDIDAAVNAVKLGAQDFIKKPLDDIDVLIFPIMKAVNHHRTLLENRRLEGKMTEYISRLKNMGSEITLAEERERRKLSEDLHDSVGQLLTASMMRLDFVMEKLKDLSFNDLKEARDIVSEALECTRSLSFQLCPPTLYTLGFGRVLNDLVMHVRKTFRIKVEYAACDDSIELSEKNRVIVYRTVRELVLNAVKHAKPSKIVISTQKDGDMFLVSVKDNGIGFKDDCEYFGEKEAGGVGLFSVEERLSAVRGTLKIKSVQGEGSEVVVSVPLLSGGIGADAAGVLGRGD